MTVTFYVWKICVCIYICIHINYMNILELPYIFGIKQLYGNCIVTRSHHVFHRGVAQILWDVFTIGKLPENVSEQFGCTVGTSIKNHSRLGMVNIPPPTIFFLKIAGILKRLDNTPWIRISQNWGETMRKSCWNKWKRIRQSDSTERHKPWVVSSHKFCWKMAFVLDWSLMISENNRTKGRLICHFDPHIQPLHSGLAGEHIKCLVGTKSQQCGAP